MSKKRGRVDVRLTEEQIPVFEELKENHLDILNSIAYGGEELGYNKGISNGAIVGGLSIIMAGIVMKLIDNFKK